MLKAAQQIAWQMPGVQFLLLKAPTIANEALSASLAQAGLEIRVADSLPYDALQLMEAAIVASGTATLEAALMGVPMVVVYRTSWPTYLAARLVVRVPHIAMVNVIAGEQLVPEFVQHRATPKRLAAAVVGLLRDAERRAAMQTALRDVAGRLGPPGAVERAAAAVRELLTAAAGRSKAPSR